MRLLWPPHVHSAVSALAFSLAFSDDFRGRGLWPRERERLAERGKGVTRSAPASVAHACLSVKARGGAPLDACGPACKTTIGGHPEIESSTALQDRHVLLRRASLSTVGALVSGSQQRRSVVRVLQSLGALGHSSTSAKMRAKQRYTRLAYSWDGLLVIRGEALVTCRGVLAATSMLADVAPKRTHPRR